MMQPAETVQRKNAPKGSGANSAARRAFLKPQVRSIFVVVADIFGQQSFQMAFVDHDHVVEQVTPATFNPAFRHAVLPQTLIRRSDWSDPQRSDGWRNL